MKHVGNLTYAPGAKKKNKRIARGQGSGHGGTATKGHKGAQSRSGDTHFRGFEGGQMPLNRRLPKFGFTNRFRVDYQIINIDRLNDLAEAKLISKDVDFELLFTAGVIRKSDKPLKILGNGELRHALNVKAHCFSESAKQKIESAGGTVSIHE